MPRPKKADGDSWIGDKADKAGYYHAFVSMGTGLDGKPDRRHVMRKDIKKVRARVKELEAERDAGVVAAKGKKPTVREMLERHLTVTMPAQGRPPNTIYSYRSICEHHIYPALGRIQADRVRDEQVEALMAKMLRSGLAPSTAVKCLAILSSAYALQVKRGAVARNPCATVNPADLGPSKATALSEDEAMAIFRAAEGRPNPVRWEVGILCGLRSGEVLGLRWEYLDIDVPEGEPGVMRVWWQLQRQMWEHGCVDAAEDELAVLKTDKARAAREAEIIAACTERWHKRPCPRRCPRIRASGRKHKCVAADAKGLCKPGCTSHAAQCPQRKGGGLVFRQLKEKRPKTLPIPPELCPRLREHRDAQFLARTAADREWEEQDLVFCQWNGRPIDANADYREWCAIVKAAKLPHHRRHAMRHSTATILIRKGVALPVVQVLLGHSDIRVTRGYVVDSDPLARDGSARMGSLLRKE